jgi:hypothetical protein
MRKNEGGKRVTHAEQLGFFKAVADANHTLINGASVLEIGAYNVNGTVRDIFATADNYTGIDLQEGPGVDLIAYGHELNHPDNSYDITISGECFEHDPHWRETFTNMVRMSRGLVAFSCASRGRREHGTRRALPDDSPGTQALGIDYYRNLNETDFQHFPLDTMFIQHRFWYLPTHFDLYFAGIKSGGWKLPDDEAVRNLRLLMHLAQRVTGAPLLRLLSRMLPEPRYQAAMLFYWKNVERRLIGGTP